MSTIEILREALIELGIPAERLTPDVRLKADLEVDSTELVEIVASAVQGSGLRIDGKALAGIDTLGRLAEFLDLRLAQVA